MHIANQATFGTKPDVVIFDIDNTLYSYQEAHLAGMDAARNKARAVLGVSLVAFDEAFDGARQEIKRALGHTASAHSRLLYFQRTIERLGMKTRVGLTLDLEQAYWRTFMLSASLRPGAKDFIMDVRSMGAITAVVTDLTAQIQFRKLIFWGLEGVFDHIVTSEEAGADKPELLPFMVLKEKLKLVPETCVWMIGDTDCDLLAKKTLGATTLLLESGGAKNASDADVIFSDFNELSEQVRGWLGTAKT